MNSFPYILTQRLVCEQLRNKSFKKPFITDKIVCTLSWLRIIHQGVKNENVYEPFVFIKGASWSKQNQRILELLSKDKNLQNCCKWIYDNIIINADIDFFASTDVKVRIATCMLTKFLDKDDYIYVCDCVIDNIAKLKLAILDEELPF